MRTAPRLLLAAVLVAAGSASAVPAAAAACDGRTGVTVVVDFAALGGGTRTGCAAGDPASGVDALRAAGHEPTRAAQQAGYFVCRIDGKPADDPCQRASPANAYWSYWHAQPGGTWTFSDTGPADRDPQPGSAEGWAFGAGDPPSSPPPARPAAAPAASPARTATQQPLAPAPARTSAAPAAPVVPASAAAPVTGAASPSAAASTVASATAPATPAASAAPSASAATAAPSTSPVASAAPVVAVPQVDDEGPGSLAGVLLGLGVVLLLAAAGVRQLQRRRTQDEAI